jgi:hypothetical protein
MMMIVVCTISIETASKTGWYYIGKAICPVCRNVFLEQDAKRLKKAAVSGVGGEITSGEELVDVIAPADKDEEAANLDIESEVTGTGLPADEGARRQ